MVLTAEYVILLGLSFAFTASIVRRLVILFLFWNGSSLRSLLYLSISADSLSFLCAWCSSRQPFSALRLIASHPPFDFCTTPVIPISVTSLPHPSRFQDVQHLQTSSTDVGSFRLHQPFPWCSYLALSHGIILNSEKTYCRMASWSPYTPAWGLIELPDNFRALLHTLR